MFQHLTVLELASVLAGPSVGMFFAELGARVIKVENLRTNGDVTRSWKLPEETKDTDITAYFSAINWGKESIAIDLKQPEGQRIVHQLARKADIVITSFIPGSAQKLGVDAETLLAFNPSLVCAEVNGYGAHEARAAFDAIIQAESGFTFLNGTPKEQFKMPVALMDVLAAHHLKEAVLLAYIRRLQTGKGGKVSISLLQAGISSLVNQAANWLIGGQIPKAKGSDHPNIVPYGTMFYTRDQKPLVLAVGNDRQFAALCKILDLPPDEQIATNPQRVIHREAVTKLLREKIALWDRNPLMAKFQEAQVPAGAVNDMQEVFQLPQAQALRYESGYLQGVKSFAAEGIDLSPTLSPPPHLSEHRASILTELGFSQEEIRSFIAQHITL